MRSPCRIPVDCHSSVVACTSAIDYINPLSPNRKRFLQQCFAALLRAIRSVAPRRAGPLVTSERRDSLANWQSLLFATWYLTQSWLVGTFKLTQLPADMCRRASLSKTLAQSCRRLNAAVAVEHEGDRAMEMLILRRKRARWLEGTHIPVSTGSDEVEALVQDLPPSEVRGLQRDDDVLRAAESMPLVLIEPISSGDLPERPAEVEVAWGIEAVRASTSHFTGKGVTVAVLDTGIDKTHPAFAGVEIVGRNFTTGPQDDVNDTNSHGTHCAGTIFGRPVNGTRIGVAPGITKAVIGKVLGPGGGSTGTLCDAINWAIEHKAQIISMSLGMDLVGFRDQLTQQGLHPKQATSTAMRALIDNVRFFDKLGNLLRSGTAFGRSALIVAASGNESDRFGQQPYVLGAAYPAASEDFLSVAALERTRDKSLALRVATFSNAGAKIAGPGVGILSSVPGGGLGVKSGTSMATPHVVGVAALWAQKSMLSAAFTAEKVLEKLKSSASLPTGLEENDVGVGIAQAPQL